jgi:hypothetical protein
VTARPQGTATTEAAAGAVGADVAAVRTAGRRNRDCRFFHGATHRGVGLPVSGVSTTLAEREQGRRLFDLLRAGDTLVVRLDGLTGLGAITAMSAIISARSCGAA